MNARTRESHRAWLRGPNGISRVFDGQLELMDLIFKTWSAHPNIERDEQVFIPTARAKSMTNQYRKIMDSVCKRKGYHSHAGGVCDLIVAWLPQFSDHCIDLLKRELVAVQAARRSGMDAQGAPELRWSLRPGYDKSNYKQTEESNRYYAEVQNMPREVKQRVYESYWDADMINCHAAIFSKWILGGDESGNADFDLMMAEPGAFLQKIIDTGAFTYRVWNSNDEPIKRAKRMRSKLFNPPKSGTIKRIGVEWYDDLAHWINEQLNEAGVSNAHMYFTALEQELIDLAAKAVGEENVCVNMHDGMILEPDAAIDPQEITAILESATGMKWKCRRF